MTLRAGSLAVVGVTTLCLSLPLASFIDGRPAPPTAYEVDLARLRRDIVAAGHEPFAGPDRVERTARFVSLLHLLAALTGTTADLEVARAALRDAQRAVGSADDLSLLEAHLEFSQHRLPEAERALARLPDLTPVRILRADIALQEGRYDAARDAYRRVVARAPTWDRLARLAYLESRLGDPLVADDLYRQAEQDVTAKDMRSYAWVRLQRGVLALRHGRHEEALAHYRQADRAYPGYWRVDEHIAEALAAQRRFGEAVARYERVIARTQRPELQQALGDLYVFMGRPADARPWHALALTAYLRSAARGEVQYYHHLATFFADVRQDGAEAVRWARRDVALRRNFATQDALAWALYRDARFVEALAVANEALSSGIRDAHLFFHAAIIHLAAGHPDDGRRLLERAGAVNPRYAAFHVHR